ncbi:MAG: DUF1512 domain-containing protein [Candidatus Freyarchaeota archaeon]|nr:DUF1512 domain-containing protein [Candidatus Jordarchaeia archaeon]MBS7278702.1 DUF1512 domain-containing protein [Candidatus Jordarchaeia archaeon]
MLFPSLQLPLGYSDPYILIMNILIFLFFIFMIFSGLILKVQSMQYLAQIREVITQLEKWSEEAKKTTIRMIRELGKPEKDPTPIVEDYMEFVLIEPVERDPSGVFKRLEHLLDVRKSRFDDLIAKLAPAADRDQRANIDMTFEAAMALRQMFLVIRHFYYMGKETNNYAMIVSVQVALSFIMKYAKAYYNALKAFNEGQPIGDGAGALVASIFKNEFVKDGNAESSEIAEDISLTPVKFEGRNVLIVRAVGPGGRVGKPGDAIVNLIKESNGKIARVIMIDAGLKFEGEKTGKVVEGVGAAIGGPGVDKFKIEQEITSQKVPVDAVIIKMSIEEALTPMKKEIYDGAYKAAERVKNMILERTKPGDTVIVAGIGNCIGIG